MFRDKGVAGIYTKAEKKGHSLQVVAGTLVHAECRRKYMKPEKSDVTSKVYKATN